MIELCVSEQLIEEYFDVLAREKFLKFTDFRTKADKVLSDIEINGSFFVPTKKVRKIKDEDDNMLLELALECRADFLVTGNSNDFTFSRYGKTKIVTPREYWENYKPE
jgi:putative PIN family toxin of toxin-antitoxin system